MTNKLYKMMGKPLEPEEFDRIKELQFRGETMKDVVEMVGRSSATVGRVFAVKTIQEYREGQQKAYRYGKYSPKKIAENGYPTPPVENATTTDRYARMKEFREKLDQVLIDFILDEVDANYRSLKMQNMKLIAENKRLKELNEQLKTPVFIDTLKGRLAEKQPKVEEEPEESVDL